MTKPRATIPEHILEMKNMNREVVMQNETCETIARAISWEGKAIMDADGYVTLSKYVLRME
jgi:hypothetical protein